MIRIVAVCIISDHMNSALNISGTKDLNLPVSYSASRVSVSDGNILMK